MAEDKSYVDPPVPIPQEEKARMELAGMSSPSGFHGGRLGRSRSQFTSRRTFNTNCLLIGVTGSGKTSFKSLIKWDMMMEFERETSLISDLLTEKDYNKELERIQDLMSTKYETGAATLDAGTTRCETDTTFTYKITDDATYNITFIDTIGFNDDQHGVDTIMEGIIHQVKFKTPVLHKIILFIKFDRKRAKMLLHLRNLMQQLHEHFGDDDGSGNRQIKPECFKIILTHVDFLRTRYVESFISDFLNLAKDHLSGLSSKDFFVFNTRNILEVRPQVVVPYRDELLSTRDKFLNFLSDTMILGGVRTSIPAALNHYIKDKGLRVRLKRAVGSFEGLIAQLKEMKIKEDQDLLNLAVLEDTQYQKDNASSPR